jgi:hypothetical protein
LSEAAPLIADFALNIASRHALHCWKSPSDVICAARFVLPTRGRHDVLILIWR